MKKLLVLCAMAFVFGIIVTANVASQPCFSDADGDGDVDGFDFNILKEEYFRSDCDPWVRIPITGQTISSATGDDGDLEKGISFPSPRFTNNGDGTVTDNLTGLIWLRNANCFGLRSWSQALSDCNSLASGSCGLTDGSGTGDWRLPNIRELHSLIDFGNDDPALSTGHPFTGVVLGCYWSSSSYANFTTSAWIVCMDGGNVESDNKTTFTYYVWPVRGEGHAPPS